MSRVTILVEGRSYISVTVVAGCYDLTPAWFERSLSLGLLDRGRRVDDVLHIPTELLERVAVIRRLQLQQGVELEAVVALLDLLEG